MMSQIQRLEHTNYSAAARVLVGVVEADHRASLAKCGDRYPVLVDSKGSSLRPLIFDLDEQK